MILTATKFQDVKLVTPTVYHDSRGFFLESCNADVEVMLGTKFAQDNHSRSKKYVIRGLHYQWEPAMGKLARVVKGSGYDVVVDIRKDSPTYGQWERFLLTEDNFRMVWVPAGFAHGFMALEDDTHLVYKASALYNGSAEGSINPLCSTLSINWGVDPDQIILSDKDRQASTFAEYNHTPKF